MLNCEILNPGSNIEPVICGILLLQQPFGAVEHIKMYKISSGWAISVVGDC